jgi:signal transduction histidine kinase/putative methionine-R-sulfoxide reductase with GAF domain
MEHKLRQRAENLGLLSELSSAITSTKDPNAVSNLIISTSISIGSGDQAILDLYPPYDGEQARIRSHNVSQQLEDGWTALGIKNNEHGMFSQETEAFFFSPIEPNVLPQRLEKIFQAEGIVALASLPIQTAHSKLGRLTILSTDFIAFSLRRRELLTLFASQAAFALSNAFEHALADVELSLQSDQLSRLEEINRQLTTSTDSDNLHEIILDHAIEASAADWGYLALYKHETDKLHFVAHSVVSGKKIKLVEDPQFESTEGIFGRAFQTGQILNIPDTSVDPNTLDPLGSQARSVLCVPVCGPEEMLGVIGVESGRPQAFITSHEQFLTQLAAYAANALHHAQIYQELQDRLTEQSLLYQASTQIAESLESDAVGLAIADSLRVTVQAETASVYYWLEDAQALNLVARIDEGRPSSKPNPVEPDINTLLGHAQCIKDRVSMQWSSNEEVSASEREYLIENYGKGRILLLPLSIGERTLGIVEIFRKDRTLFNEAAIRSAQSIAIQASIALDNTELFQKISESHNRLTAILNSTREGILLVDTEGVISIANKQMESMIEVGIQDLLQHALDDPSLDLASRLGYLPQDLKQLVESLRQGQAQLAGTATYESASDSGKTHFRIDAPVYDPSSQLIGWLISIRDISEQKEIEDTREQLTEMIVHDLRSPLTAILNSIVLMRRELDAESSSSAVEQALGVADRSVNQMLGLVNSLLDIARLESGKLKISPENVSIKPLMLELHERFQIEANSIGIILNSVYSDSDVTASIDREKIRRVLANLLDNALKFTPVGGVIELGFSDKSQEVIFWVSDTGPGIPSEFQEKIFERYIQIPGSTGRRRGTGLGLAFAKLAVEAHGGRLWVEEHPMGGSVFKFSLPYDKST